MQRIDQSPSFLFSTATRLQFENQAKRALPPHTLMQRAGLAVAQLACALAPHARTIWIACGSGNNGGDGFEAALHLQRWGKQVWITCTAPEQALPPDAQRSRQRALDAGMAVQATAPQHLTRQDLCIDALLGSAPIRPLSPEMVRCITAMNQAPASVLSIDCPSGLDPDSGHFATTLIANNSRQDWTNSIICSQNTLCMIAARPGLFTADGRDHAGTVWLADLGLNMPEGEAIARLSPRPTPAPRPHASHKGSYGDVVVIGGAPGMRGAAALAATAALASGAGRVYLCPMDSSLQNLHGDPPHPALMMRPIEALDLKHAAVVCGCGGGTRIGAVLDQVLAQAQTLVLDADALNAIATTPALRVELKKRCGQNRPTVLTPHPLEAARLLATTTASVQQDRLAAARQLADQFGCTVVLKGSGTVITTPGFIPQINPTGNARLATAGTGDVLAGMVGTQLAAGVPAPEAASAAVHRHGQMADEWPTGAPFNAALLASAATA